MPFANRSASQVFLAGFFLILASCGGTEEEISPSANRIVDAAKFIEITDRGSFHRAMQEAGDATGFGGGEFDVDFDGYAYSEDCEASFLMERDVFYPDRLTEQETEDLIQEGYPAFSASIDFAYREGVIQIENQEWDGEPVQGPLNEDGQFQIVFGDYPDADYRHFFVYKGRFLEDGCEVEGTFQGRVHSWDKEPRGSCTIASKFHGINRRLSCD